MIVPPFTIRKGRDVSRDAVLATLIDTALRNLRAVDGLRYQVDTRTVVRWRAAGRLKSVRTAAGRRALVRIPNSDLIEFLGGVV
jgi:hypothetical protein